MSNFNLDNFYKNMIRVGKVSSIDPKHATARVFFDDKEDLVSYDLPMIIPQSLKNKDYYMPDIGEKVICIFLANGIQQGFILGSFYSKKDIPPRIDPNKRHTVFKDDTWFEYDRVLHLLQWHVYGIDSGTRLETKRFEQFFHGKTPNDYGKTKTFHLLKETDAGELTIGAEEERDSFLLIPEDSAWNFRMNIVGRAGNIVASWNIDGVATTESFEGRFVGTPIKTSIWKDIDASPWEAWTSLNGNKLSINVSADMIVKWSARVEVTEVTTQR